MSESIIQLVDTLPSNNLTVKVLNALDYVIPGKWQNVVGFDNTIKAVTGVSDANTIMQIRNRAIELYNDKSKGYQQAIWLYQTVDGADKAMGAAAMANKVGEKIGFLSFLNKLTPKADTIQSVDLCLKIVVELLAYAKINGLPSINPKTFATEINQHYTDAALMRMAALVCIDGLVPLGANFLQKVQNTLSSDGQSAFTSNPVFSSVSSLIPGDDKFGFISNSFTAVSGWMTNLVGSAGLTPQNVFAHLEGFIEFSDDKLDFVAAFLDQATNYYEHTGIQTVARALILKAAQEI